MAENRMEEGEMECKLWMLEIRTMSDSWLNRAEEPDSSMPRRCKEAQQPRNKQIHLTEIRKG